MGRISSMDVSASGLSAQRRRLDAIAENIANANTTRTAEGGPYRRKETVFAARLDQAAPASIGPGGWAAAPLGVMKPQVVEDARPAALVHNPGHPDANVDGFVEMPNVNVVEEMVDMISATRAYEANVTAMNAAKSMAMKALEIGKG